MAHWYSVRLRSERSRFRNLPPPCCVLEQDTLLSKSTGNTQEAEVPSRLSEKNVDWDVKPQHKQTKHPNLDSEASGNLLYLHCPVCDGTGQRPRRQVLPLRGAYYTERPRREAILYCIPITCDLAILLDTHRYDLTVK